MRNKTISIEIAITRTISPGALIKRINRKLRREGEVLHTLRGERDWSSLGRYYVVNDRNCVCAQHLDLEDWGREMGVLKPHEGVD